MQKTSFFKRIMTLFLAFIMMLGLLPISQFVEPAYAAESSGEAPSTISMNYWELKSSYQSKNLVPAKTIPRTFIFDVGDGVAPGFCADHSKDINLRKGETWQSPVPIEETDYAIAIPLIAWYNYGWYLSRQIDDTYGTSKTEAEKDAIALEMSGGLSDYWSEFERIVATGIPQAAIWLIGNGKLTDLNNPDQVRMVAEERNATVTAMISRPASESEDEVIRWINGMVNSYAEGKFGTWHIYLYQPAASGKQPIVTSVPDTPTPEGWKGWIKLKKTDLSGNNLSGATFGVYSDANCQVRVGEFTTTEDEWTYYEISRMDKASQTFYLKETSAPPGYTVNSQVYDVAVSSTNNSTKETAAAVNGGAPIKNGNNSAPALGV